MQVSEWDRANRSLQAALRRAVIEELSALQGRRLDESTIEVITQRMFAAVRGGQNYSRELARRYYTEFLGARGIGAPVAQPPPAEYAPAALTDGLRRVLAPAGGMVTADTLGRALQVGHKHVQDSGRRSMIAQVLRDERLSGWARADPKPPTCAFCLMLISRGPVYRSRATAGAANRWHIGCSCQVVPVAGGDWEGRNQYEQAERLYVASAAESRADPLNAMRRKLGQQRLPAAATS